MVLLQSCVRSLILRLSVSDSSSQKKFPLRPNPNQVLAVLTTFLSDTNQLILYICAVFGSRHDSLQVHSIYLRRASASFHYRCSDSQVRLSKSSCFHYHSIRGHTIPFQQNVSLHPSTSEFEVEIDFFFKLRYQFDMIENSSQYRKKSETLHR